MLMMTCSVTIEVVLCPTISSSCFCDNVGTGRRSKGRGVGDKTVSVYASHEQTQQRVEQTHEYNLP